jgi:glutamate formiminotransferase
LLKIVECVPNFSEGRRKDVIEKILGEIRGVEGAKLLDSEPDADHNRCVVTFVGEPDAAKEAAFRAIKKAAELIDMDAHKGEHPRMGATDVVPFIPVKGVTMDECIRLANELGERVGRELGIPVYLYESAARRPERKNLADVRKGEYEGIKAEIETNPARKPDYGPSKMGKAGATVIGARPYLVAYNVNLATTDLSVAKAIAKKIREKDGGFPRVKALGFDIKEKGYVQVSMNLCDYTATGIKTVFDAISVEAAARGVKVLNSEIIGLLPAEALIDVAVGYLNVSPFSKDQVIENRL